MKQKNKITDMFASAILALGIIDSPLLKKISDRFNANPDGPAGARTVGDLIFSVLQILLLVAGGLATLFIVIGGIRYVLARGNEEQAEQAKKTITAAVWGLAIIIMAFAIVFIISSALIEGEGGLGV